MFTVIKRWLQSKSRRTKRLIMVVIDATIIPLGTWAAFSLRVGELWPEMLADRPWLLVAMPVVGLPMFAFSGMYQPVIRYIGPSFIKTIVIATALSALAMPLMVLLARDDAGFQRTAPAIYFLIVGAGLGGVRVGARWWFAGMSRTSDKIIIYGAGQAGARLVSALSHSGGRVVAVVDDAKSLHGTTIRGVRVYQPEELPDLVQKTAATDVLLAIPSLGHDRRRLIIESLIKLPVHVRTIPDLDELVAGTAGFGELRYLRVEDLLGRAVVPPQSDLLDMAVAGRSVMVTGAGGSIGAELSHGVIQSKCSKLILVERSEPALFEVLTTLERKHKNACIIPILADVQETDSIKAAMDEHSVQTVFHAAAHKHVPLVEQNEVEAVSNNIFGTQSVLKAALDTEVDRFVLVSTDKAVRPSSVMGATKRVSEMLAQSMANQAMRICMVRFGNVLGSSGSVVPIFRRQLEDGGPITVTDPDMVRYFMTIPEAANLVIQAGGIADDGEVLLLDMGDPMKIVELARLMIRLSGMTERTDQDPRGDIEIVYTGQRGGEKTHEELLVSENALTTSHPQIFRALEPVPPAEWLEGQLEALTAACQDRDAVALREVLFATVESSAKEANRGA